MDAIEDGKFLNGTLEWMVDTYPETYGKLKTDDNDWKERGDVRIAYNRQWFKDPRPAFNAVGQLSAGYGGNEDGHQIGPELGFGWTVGDELGSSDVKGSNGIGTGTGTGIDILLVKVAWGGRSLAVEFRPPSSGGVTGLYYEGMLAHVFKALAHLPDLVPGYTHDRGYSLEGFAWHQGWNDGCDANMTAEYESNLANLIRDVRTDLEAPGLPVVVGVSGMNGWNPSGGDPKRGEIIKAQLAVANATLYPEFAGTVAGVETRDFFRGAKPVSPGDQIYHWNNNCESYWLIGQAMGRAMVDLVSRRTNGRAAAPAAVPAAVRRDHHGVIGSTSTSSGGGEQIGSLMVRNTIRVNA